MDANYTKELRKDIKAIKKDLRSVNIKTRTIFRELEKNNFKVTTIKKKPQQKITWWRRIINKLLGLWT
jgi:hypothetical protein